jgi:hypothetical protein
VIVIINTILQGYFLALFSLPYKSTKSNRQTTSTPRFQGFLGDLGALGGKKSNAHKSFQGAEPFPFGFTSKIRLFLDSNSKSKIV